MASPTNVVYLLICLSVERIMGQAAGQYYNLNSQRIPDSFYNPNYFYPRYQPRQPIRIFVINEEAQNKQLVLSFYQEVFGDKNVDSADKYIDQDVYIQHNPHVADGREAFKTAAREWFHNAPRERIDLQRISADGDLVWVHTRSKDEQGKVLSVIDIFRLDCGKIVEHWDVMQTVPDQSANSHPMF